MAVSLIKRFHFLEDCDGYRYELHYIWDKVGREVDFTVIKEGLLIESIEVKYSDENISKNLLFYIPSVFKRKKPLKS